MPVRLPETARAVIDSGALGHLVTVNRDGSPQVAIVWVGIDGDDLVTAHLSGAQQKLRNVTRDSRVVVSFEAPTTNALAVELGKRKSGAHCRLCSSRLESGE
jgi:hypothetical protein